jgi:hypothetical protein
MWLFVTLFIAALFHLTGVLHRLTFTILSLLEFRGISCDETSDATSFNFLDAFAWSTFLAIQITSPWSAILVVGDLKHVNFTAGTFTAFNGRLFITFLGIVTFVLFCLCDFRLTFAILGLDKVGFVLDVETIHTTRLDVFLVLTIFITLLLAD